MNERRNPREHRRRRWRRSARSGEREQIPEKPVVVVADRVACCQRGVRNQVNIRQEKPAATAQCFAVASAYCCNDAAVDRDLRGFRSRYYARICGMHFTAPDGKSMRRKTPTRIDQMLTLAVLALLIVGCFLVLQPFITAVVWAAILCVTSWPLFSRLRKRFQRHDWFAALLMLVLITVALFAPFVN